MEKSRNFWRFVAIVLGALFFLAGMDIDRGEKLNAALKQQVAEWQAVGLRAVKARGWDDVKQEDVTPRLLNRALIPCYEKNGDFVRTPECAYAAKYSVLENLPIKITWR